MRYLLRTLFFLQVLGLASLTVAQVAHHQEPSFTITVSVAQNVFSVGSEVKLYVSMKNISDGDIHYAVGLPGPIFRIEFLDSRGEPVPETPYGRRVHGTDPKRKPFVGSVFADTVQPGKTLEEQWILDKEYDLSKPGNYTVQASRWDSTSNTIVKSNKITITITP